MNAMLRTNRRQRNVVFILVPVLALLIIAFTYTPGDYKPPRWPRPDSGSGSGGGSTNGTSEHKSGVSLSETDDGLLLASAAFNELSTEVLDEMNSHLLLTEKEALDANEKAQLDTCANRNKKAFKSFEKKMSNLKSSFDARIKSAGDIGCRTPIAEAVRERVDEMAGKAIKYERLKAVDTCKLHIDEERAHCVKLIEAEKANLKQLFENQGDANCVFNVGQCVDRTGDCMKGLRPLLERYYEQHRDWLYEQKLFSLNKDSYKENREKDIPLREEISRITEKIDLNLPTSAQFPNKDREPGKLRPEQILVLSGSTEQATESRYVNRTSKALKNRQAYCDFWGYHHKFLNFTRFKSDGVEHPVWYKIPAIQEQFKLHPEIEWIWWLDADAFIMNGNYDLIDRLLDPPALEKLILYNRPVANIESVFNLGSAVPSKEDMAKPEDMVFIISHDWLTFNAGSFFIKRSALADMTLESWGSPLYVRDSEGYATFERREQDAFISLYLSHPSIQKHTAVVPQRLINAYTNGGHFHEFDIMQWKAGDFVLHLAGLRGSEFEEAFDYNQDLIIPPGTDPKAPRHTETSPPEGDYVNNFADLLGPDYTKPELEPDWSEKGSDGAKPEEKHSDDKKKEDEHKSDDQKDKDKDDTSKEAERAKAKAKEEEKAKEDEKAKEEEKAKKAKESEKSKESDQGSSSADKSSNKEEPEAEFSESEPPFAS